jgi:hypothetical protein
MEEDDGEDGKESSADETLKYSKELLIFMIKKDFQVYRIFQVCFGQIESEMSKQLKTLNPSQKKFAFCFQEKEALKNHSKSDSESIKKMDFEERCKRLWDLVEKVLYRKTFEHIISELTNLKP